MRSFFVLFAFIFYPLAIDVSGSIKTNKKEDWTKILASSPKSASDTTMYFASNWTTAEASYYDSKDKNQTREDCNGAGAFGREIKSGSIALGSAFTEFFLKKEMEVYIQVENLDVVTPYGKGIFRVDDVMHNRFNKKGNFYVDFFHKDLSSKLKRMGRFKIKFRICKISSKTVD